MRRTSIRVSSDGDRLAQTPPESRVAGEPTFGFFGRRFMPDDAASSAHPRRVRRTPGISGSRLPQRMVGRKL